MFLGLSECTNLGSGSFMKTKTMSQTGRSGMFQKQGRKGRKTPTRGQVEHEEEP